MRDRGASHSDVAEHLAVSRARAEQLAGIAVRLVGGPRDGDTMYTHPAGHGRPNRQLVVMVPGGGLNYWRPGDPETDRPWAADFFPATTTPGNWVEDSTVI